MDEIQRAEPPLPGPVEPGQLRAWRTQLRTRLLRERAALSPALQAAASGRIFDRLTSAFPQIWTKTVGLYWPMRGELDLTRVVGRIRSAGGTTALPVVTRKNAPLEFHGWNPDVLLIRDACGIPCPPPGISVEPEVLLVPALGFDAGCYRLGYGGGYYDRTLAVLSPRPLTIGIGFEFGRIATIYPQPFDIPLDFIVSEQSIHSPPKAQDTVQDTVAG